MKYYPQAWPTSGSRPGANICTIQYDFDTYYKSRMNAIKGFTKTKYDPASVHAWEVARRPYGLVDVKWKPEARMSAAFLGVDSTSTSAGFIVLRNASPLAPTVVPGGYQEQTIISQIKRDINSTAMGEHLSAEGLVDAVPWLLECCDTGNIPVHRVIEPQAPPGEIGRLVEIGVASRIIQVRAMDSPPPETAEKLFELPPDLLRRMEAHAKVSSDILQDVRLPVLSQENPKSKPQKKPASATKPKTKPKTTPKTTPKTKSKTKSKTTPNEKLKDRLKEKPNTKPESTIKSKRQRKDIEKEDVALTSTGKEDVEPMNGKAAKRPKDSVEPDPPNMQLVGALHEDEEVVQVVPRLDESLIKQTVLYNYAGVYGWCRATVSKYWKQPRKNILNFELTYAGNERYDTALLESKYGGTEISSWVVVKKKLGFDNHISA